MKFFDKFLDKMIEKKPLPQKERIDLENFHKNEEHNAKLRKKFVDRIVKDMKKIQKCDFAKLYISKVHKETEDMVANLKAYSHHDRFSEVFSYLINCSRWYALYYLNTDESRKDTEIDKVSDRLTDLYDVTILHLLKHFNYDRREPLIYKNCQIFYQTNEEGKTIADFSASKISQLSNLVFAIRDQDNNKVFDAYNKLGDSNLMQFSPSPFPEFE